MDFQGAKEYIQTRLKEELPHSLYYHGYQHTVDVCVATERFAQLEGVDAEDITLLKTAAWFHDSGFLTTYSNHEAVGIELAERILPDFGFNDEQISKIAGMIASTKIPQNPQNHLEQILCDADLEYLGGKDYYPIAESLRKELDERNLLADHRQWVEMQIKFLQTHHYFTDTAKELCNKQKEDRLKELQYQLERLEIER